MKVLSSDLSSACPNCVGMMLVAGGSVDFMAAEWQLYKSVVIRSNNVIFDLVTCRT